MDNHKKTSPSGLENQGTHLCHKCGWPFPNPHPSAKHRRAHKRICGTIEGYKLIDLGEKSQLTVSDDERVFDEDPQTPSPKLEKKTINDMSSGRVGERSNRSEDEVFADAVTESSDNGLSIGNDEQLEGARGADKMVEDIMVGDNAIDQQLKVDTTADYIQIPNNQTEGRPVNDLDVLETLKSQPGNTTTSEDIASIDSTGLVLVPNNSTKEVFAGDGSANGLAGNLPAHKLEVLADASKQYVEDNSNKNQENDVKRDEKSNVDEVAFNVAAPCLEKNNIDEVAFDVTIPSLEKSNVDKAAFDAAAPSSQTANEAPQVASNSQENDAKERDPITAGYTLESMAEQSNKLGPDVPLKDLSSKVQSAEAMKVFGSSTQSVQDADSSPGDSIQVFYTEGKDSDNVHVFSSTNELPMRSDPDIMLENSDDHTVMKLYDPVTLDYGELTESMVDDRHSTIYEESSSVLRSIQSVENMDTPPMHLPALIGTIQGDDGACGIMVTEVPVEGKEKTPEFNVCDKDTKSCCSEAPAMLTACETKKPLPDPCPEGPQDPSAEKNSFKEIFPIATAMDCSVEVPMTISRNNNVGYTTIETVGDNAHDHDKVRSEKVDTDGKDGMEEIICSGLTENVEATLESADNLSASVADQTLSLFGAGSSRGDRGAQDVADKSMDMALVENPAINLKMTPESVCFHSDHQIVTQKRTDIFTRNIHENLSAYLVLGSSRADTGHSGPTSFNSLNRPKEESQDASNQAVAAKDVDAVCVVTESNDNNFEELPKISETNPAHLPANLEVATGSSTAVEDSHCADGIIGVSSNCNEFLQEKDENNPTKRHIGGSALNISVDSSSQGDSVEGNWGSISVLSTQSDAHASNDTAAAAPDTEKSASMQSSGEGGHLSSKSDAFEPPSFMTLVEPGCGADQKAASSEVQMVQNAQHPNSEGLQAAWFPSLTNVIKDSQGRKKNEEIITKVSNWSMGKQHTPLKSLLNQAIVETKPKSANQKQTPTTNQKDERATKNNAASIATVDSIPGPEICSDLSANKELTTKEWNSPAAEIKKEKRKVKGRPNWVPFVCCSSIH